MTNSEAIETLRANYPDSCYGLLRNAVDTAIYALSAQPVAKDINVPTNDCISRKWLMECVEEGWIKFDTEKDENKFIHLVRDTAPSAQPEEIALHESCTNCPLYDNDRHSCPRFNKVIPETLREVQSDKRLEKIADLVEGAIDHFDKDDAMDLLYQIKEVLNER